MASYDPGKRKQRVQRVSRVLHFLTKFRFLVFYFRLVPSPFYWFLAVLKLQNSSVSSVSLILPLRLSSRFHLWASLFESCTVIRLCSSCRSLEWSYGSCCWHQKKCDTVYQSTWNRQKTFDMAYEIYRTGVFLIILMNTLKSPDESVVKFFFDILMSCRVK